MSKILRNFARRVIPQSEPASPKQERNNAGGYSFTLDGEKRLDRFLILGTDSGTYYVSPQKLTEDNAAMIQEEIESRGRAVVDQIVAVSHSGRAPKNDQALFALAVASAAADPEVRRYALSRLNEVARIPTHLFQFLGYLREMRGWGRQVRRAVSRWYLAQDTETLAYRLVKYRNREGWTHRDVLALAHTVSHDPAQADVLRWAVTGKTKGVPPRVIADFLAANQKDADVPALIRAEGSQLSREMLPSESLNDREVWAALVDADRLPQTALIRSLKQMSGVGLFGPVPDKNPDDSDTAPGFADSFDHDFYVNLVASRITDHDRLRRARVHPIQVLVAQRTYARYPHANATLVDALDKAFYLAFESVPQTKGRTMHAVDVSGSMGARSSGVLTCSEAAAALVKVGLAAHSSSLVTAFSSTMVPVTGVTAQQSLRDTMDTFARITMGRTDCAQPMLYALEHKIPVDTFIVYTDNETWFGKIHPHEALKQYRDKSQIPAKLIVVALTATKFTIADPDDPGMLDVVGFDASLPSVIEEFSTPERLRNA